MQPLIDFYKAKRKSLVYVASKRVGPDWAEDAVQEAFELAVRYYHTYNPAISEFKTWFSSIFNTGCRNIKNANNGRFVEIQEGDWVGFHKPEDAYFLDEILAKIEGYSHTHKQVLYCAFALQYKNSQISMITGVHILNVVDIKDRFCAKMRERYGEVFST